MATTSNDWTNTPASDSTAANTIDTLVNNIRTDVQERMDIDHEWNTTDTGSSDIGDIGKHKKVNFMAPIATPTNVTDEGFLYTKDVSSKAELHWEDEDGNEVQLTSAGSIGASGESMTMNNATVAGTLGVTGNVAVNTNKFNVTAASGNTTVAGTLGVTGATTLTGGGTLGAALAAGSNKITGLADGTADGDAVNMGQYADAAGAFLNYSSSGGESCTLPNGLIMKMGSVTASSNEQTVAFDDAFPSGIVSVQITPYKNGATGGVGTANICATDVAVGSFNIAWAQVDWTGAYWFAIGY